MKLYIDATKVETNNYTTLVSIYLNGEIVEEGTMQRAEINVIEIPFKGEEIKIRFDAIMKSEDLKYKIFPCETYEHLVTLNEENDSFIRRIKKEFLDYKRMNLLDKKYKKSLEIGSGKKYEVLSPDIVNGCEEMYLTPEIQYLYVLKMENIDAKRESLLIYFSGKAYGIDILFPLPLGVLKEENVEIYRKIEEQELENHLKKCIKKENTKLAWKLAICAVICLIGCMLTTIWILRFIIIALILFIPVGIIIFFYEDEKLIYRVMLKNQKVAYRYK